MDKYKLDFYRMTGKEYSLKNAIMNFPFSHRLKYMKYFRKMQESKGIFKLFYRFFLLKLGRKYGIEIGHTAVIGEGFAMFHPYNITINGGAVLGKNINISKGATIGAENRGKRRGAPIIGNNVFIGINSTIVGKVMIGDNVVIAPNSYVNQDIPDNSIVIGNPCRIIHNEKATEGYVNYRI